jgi:hypothetical protein
MTATIVSLCDSLVNQLNSESWSQSFVAERYYQPDFKRLHKTFLKQVRLCSDVPEPLVANG